MGHFSAWLGAPKWKVGLDNLGTQQPCVFLYSALLPGITNVTDRAWHYGFYPWLVVNLDRRYPDIPDPEFRFLLRKADCLATLISARHAIRLSDNDDRKHGHAFPGRNKLLPAAREISAGASIRLSVFADPSSDNENRYFQASLGGLGQYYLGVLRDDLNILAGERRIGVKYVEETAGPLAAAFAAGLPENEFFDAMERDEISVGTLDSLAPFCPCSLSSGGRQIALHHLVDIILARAEPWRQAGLPRKRSLSLILDFLAQANGVETDREVKSFLASCYGQALPNGKAWNLMGTLMATRDLWALYTRNEMLSLAWEGIFSAVLDEIGRQRSIPGIREAAAWCLDRPAFKSALENMPHANFAEAVEADSAAMPALDDLHHSDHEIAIWGAIVKQIGAKALLPSIRMIIRLVGRHGIGTNNYAPFRLAPTKLADYPLTLDTLAVAASGPWRALPTATWLATLIATTLSVHQRVALRKLGDNGDDTLMFRTGEDGIIIERHLKEIAETQPRLAQAFQILRDLGLTTPAANRKLPILTPDGQRTLQECRND